MKILELPRRHILLQSQQRKHQNNGWNLFKVNNKDTRATSVMLHLLLLTLNLFHKLLWCFHCGVWTNKCHLGWRVFVNSEYISFTVILCLMFTFNIYLCASAKAGLKTKVSIVDPLMYYLLPKKVGSLW